MSTAADVFFLRNEGFSEDEIADHIAPDVKFLRDTGFSEQEIGEHFGVPSDPPFDVEPIQKHLRTAIEEATAAPEEGSEPQDFTFMQALEAGMQASNIVMMGRASLPDTMVGEDASTFDRIVSQTATVAFDLPVYGLGFAAAGGATGNPLIAVGGSFALPAALREVLIRTYRDGKIETFAEFWDVFSAAMIAEVKGLATGAAVAAVGPFAGGAGIAAGVGAGAGRAIPFIGSAAARTAEVGAMVTVGSALEGRIPDANEFIDAAAVISVLTGAKKIRRSLYATYKTTGKRPAEVLEDIQRDTTIKEDLASKNHSEEPRAYKAKVEPAKAEEVVAEVDAKVGKETADILRGKDNAALARELIEGGEPPTITVLQRKLQIGRAEAESLLDGLVRDGTLAKEKQGGGLPDKHVVVEDALPKGKGKSALDQVQKVGSFRDFLVTENGKGEYESLLHKFKGDAALAILEPKLHREFVGRKLLEDRPAPPPVEIVEAIETLKGGLINKPLGEVVSVNTEMPKEFDVIISSIPTGLIKPKHADKMTAFLSKLFAPKKTQIQMVNLVSPLHGRWDPVGNELLVGKLEPKHAPYVVAHELGHAVYEKIPDVVKRYLVDGLNPDIAKWVDGKAKNPAYGDKARAHDELFATEFGKVFAERLGKPVPDRAGVISTPNPKHADVINQLLGLDGGGAKGPPPPVGLPATAAPPPGGGKPPSALEKVMESISFDAKKVRRTPRQWIDHLYADWFKSQHPLNKAVREAGAGADFPIVENAAKLKQLEAGVVAKIGGFLEYDMRNFAGEIVGPGLKKILRPIDGELRSLSAYLVAKRTLEVGTMTKKVLNPATGKTETVEVSRSGVDLKDAAAAVVEGRAKYEKATQELLTFQRQVLEYLRDAELISKESFDFMTAAGKNYTPLHRVIEEQVGVTSKGVGRTAHDPIFRFRGSELDIINPLESIIKNTYAFILVADRNQIGVQFTRQMELAGRTDLASRARVKSRPIDIKPEEVKRAIKKFDEGRELSESEASALEAFAEDGFTVFRPNGLKVGKNQIAVFEGGKKTIWDIDPEVMRVFDDGTSLTNNIIMKVLSAPARLLRAGAVLSPEFTPRNVARDNLTAFIVSDHKLRLIVDSAHGLGHVWNQNSKFQDWVANGGASAAMVSLDRDYLSKRGIADLMGPKGVSGQLFNAVKNPVEMLRLVAELGESATRLGEFERALKGKERTKENMLEAALAAREVSLDFAQMGTQARAVNMIVPFFSAQLNGVDKIVRSFKDHPKRTAAKITSGITVPSMMLWYINHDKEWYKEAPRWMKDWNWLIMHNDVLYKIPKPFEVGLIFGTGAERMMDSIIDEDPKAFDGFGEALFEAVTPSFFPTTAAGVFESWANKKLFFDTPIVPGPLEKILPEYQFKPYTTELSKSLGRWIASFPTLKQSKAASPLMIENFVSSWTGGLGRTVLNGVDLALRKVGALPDPVKPAHSILLDIPAVKGFVVRHPMMSTQQVQEFFERLQENRKIANTFNMLLAQGNTEDAMREFELGGAGAIANLNGLAETITGLTAVARAVTNPVFEHTAEEQRQIIDAIYINIHMIAVEGLAVMDDLEAEQ